MTLPDQVALKRTLSLPRLVFYGLGTTIGAGIYALAGEMAAVSGYQAPVSFLLASVMAMPPDRLAQSTVPLVRLYEHYTESDATIISIIGLFAMIKGALIQVILASRVLYDMSSRSPLPAIFRIVNQHKQTPLVATALSTVAILLLAASGSLAALAEAASLIMLVVFSLVNLSLIAGNSKTPETGRPDCISTDDSIMAFWLVQASSC